MVSCQISQVDSAEMELLLVLGDTMKTLSDIKYLSFRGCLSVHLSILF